MPLPSVVFALSLLVACATDVRSRRIPNGLSLFLALGGVVVAAAGQGAVSVGTAATGLLAGLGIWLPFWLLGMLGAGDVKFFAAGAAWLGARGALEAALLAGLAGGLLSLTYLLARRGAGYTVLRLWHGMHDPAMLREVPTSPMDERLPYALAMAAGLALAYWAPGLLLERGS